ncbi:hypothetical protein ACLB0R_09235 [Sphingomonas sp. GlSt437]|uniref:hypothetical protein n=1 Tax=Sphingomonas sp. GlSt437 TaxID=3389970 RepID=UPI003A858703
MPFPLYPTPPAPEGTGQLGRPQLSRDTMPGYIYNNGDAFAQWQRLVDAGLIGNPQPMAPELLARAAEAEALFRRIRLETEAAERASEWR